MATALIKVAVVVIMNSSYKRYQATNTESTLFNLNTVRLLTFISWFTTASCKKGEKQKF